MKCVKNPLTGEVKRLDDLAARKLISYSWVYVTKSEYRAWVVTQAMDKLPMSMRLR